MKFSFLLYVLARKLKSASKKKPQFKEKLKENNITVLIKTADNKRARSFTFDNGEVSSKIGVVDKFDFALVWSDAAIGFRVMASGSNDATMKALSEGKLKLEGEGSLALWFTSVIKEMDR